MTDQAIHRLIALAAAFINVFGCSDDGSGAGDEFGTTAEGSDTIDTATGDTGNTGAECEPTA